MNEKEIGEERREKKVLMKVKDGKDEEILRKKEKKLIGDEVKRKKNDIIEVKSDGEGEFEDNENDGEKSSSIEEEVEEKESDSIKRKYIEVKKLKGMDLKIKGIEKEKGKERLKFINVRLKYRR